MELKLDYIGGAKVYSEEGSSNYSYMRLSSSPRTWCWYEWAPIGWLYISEEEAVKRGLEVPK